MHYRHFFLREQAHHEVHPYACIMGIAFLDEIHCGRRSQSIGYGIIIQICDCQ